MTSAAYRMTLAAEFARLTRVTVHPDRDAVALTLHCGCELCDRVSAALERGADLCRLAIDTAHVQLVESQRLEAVSAVDLIAAEARIAREDALILAWRAVAATEGTEATRARAMSPAMRSAHNHRALIYKVCAMDLAALKRPA